MRHWIISLTFHNGERLSVEREAACIHALAAAVPPPIRLTRVYGEDGFQLDFQVAALTEYEAQKQASTLGDTACGLMKDLQGGSPQLQSFQVSPAPQQTSVSADSLAFVVHFVDGTRAIVVAQDFTRRPDLDVYIFQDSQSRTVAHFKLEDVRAISRTDATIVFPRPGVPLLPTNTDARG